ncbi:GDSL esterase/lipase At4g10955-like [Impatiens glandulifera]|uniref:GDSL esterase/lipase At4g10955-like n=1 Tax=Impatiens glandulifera TaxID=253017 RepID=UPI001FB0B4A3|nr:GDSL esterase/lipase At4g10955-like [Impatiens glandulifera]
MPSDREIFGLSGPVHLTALDWKNPIHRRSVAASLVQGVYIQERDRQQSRLGPESLAPPWWEFFHFQLNHILLDESDLSIFGAIYESKLWNPHHNYPGQSPPKYVIAFRGTITKKHTRMQDLKLDLHLLADKLQHTPRFKLAMATIQDMIKNVGAANFWVTGHSLGSAIGLLAGKNIVRKGLGFIESYLFNPPFVSAPIGKIKNEKLNHAVRLATSFVTAGVSAAVHGGGGEGEMGFECLSEWIPYLFVNSYDPICMEYVGYFEHRVKMEEAGAGAGRIGRLATQNSIIGSLIGGGRRRREDGETAHLLPSAFVTVNLSNSPDLKTAHGIHQWWNPHIQIESKLYKFLVPN